MRTSRFLAILAVVEFASCATTQVPNPGVPHRVVISDLGVAFRSDRRTDVRDRRLGERAASDIILVKATIQNPFPARQSVVLACRRTDSTRPAVERQFTLPAGSRENLTLSGFMADPLPYRLACQIRGTGQDPSIDTNWVEVVVPANDALLSAPI